MESMIDIRGNRDVAFAGQPFAHAKQLPAHAVAFHHHDDPGARRVTRASHEAGSRQLGRIHGFAPPAGQHSGLSHAASNITLEESR